MDTSRWLLSPAGVVTFSFFEVLLPQWKTSHGGRLSGCSPSAEGWFCFLLEV